MVLRNKGKDASDHGLISALCASAHDWQMHAFPWLSLGTRCNKLSGKVMSALLHQHAVVSPSQDKLPQALSLRHMGHRFCALSSFSLLNVGSWGSLSHMPRCLVASCGPLGAAFS